jgi:Meckel syndrome type 1 protein
VNDTFVPSYARKPVRQKKVRTWMVLAPIAAVALLGGGAYMLMDNGETAQPLVEPASAPTASAMAPTVPTTEAALAPMTSAATPAPIEATPAPVTRTSAPVRTAPLVARRESAPVRSGAAGSASAPRIETPAQPAGPQPYGATSSLNTATPAPRMANPSVGAPAPAITVQPLN